MPGTVRLHRVLRAPAERVYRAFTNPHAMAKWSPPDGFYAIYDHLEPEVGGTYKASFINFTTGEKHSFGGEFKEMIENERIRYIDIFDDPNLPGAMEVTITLKPVSCGTELTIVQDGIPDVIPVEMCYLGWQESMLALARLVEPEIKQ